MATRDAAEPGADHTCPRCSSSDVARVPRAGARDHLVRTLLRWRVYRCAGCGHRFYDRPSARTAS